MVLRPNPPGFSLPCALAANASPRCSAQPLARSEIRMLGADQRAHECLVNLDVRGRNASDRVHPRVMNASVSCAFA